MSGREETNGGRKEEERKNKGEGRRRRKKRKEKNERKCGLPSGLTWCTSQKKSCKSYILDLIVYHLCGLWVVGCWEVGDCY